MPSIAMIMGIIVMLLVLVGSNCYITFRLYQGVKYIFPQLSAIIFIILGIIMVLPFILGFTRSMLPVSETVKRIFGVITSYWMGIFLYLFLYFLLADIILLLLRIIKAIQYPMPQGTYFFTGILMVLITAITVSYGIYNANRIKQVTYNIRLGKKAQGSEFNLILLSDLHLGAVGSEKRLEKLVQSINIIEPDIVCIAGDIFDNDYHAIHNPEEAIRLLKTIKSKYGVYACLGNHDAGRTFDKMLDFLERCNIKTLNDEYAIIDDRLVLIGRLDSSPIGGFGDMKRKNIEEIMSGIDTKLPVIVMDHNPIHIGEYGNEVDLILSGHTHRGQIFPGDLFTRALFVVDYGYYRKDDNSPHIVVTSGTGTWGMPMRIGSDCEIVNIYIR